MPVASQTAARDEMHALFKTAWDVGAPTIPVLYADVKKNPPADASPFVRITIQHATGYQATLAGDVGQRRFRREGVITVQIFTPFGEGLQNADSLAKIAVEAFEGQSSVNGIWFRNARVNEVGQDGDRFQTNVLIDFIYDEIK